MTWPREPMTGQKQRQDTLESRMTERHESIIFTCSNVARRAGCSRVGAGPATGMGQAPFQSEALSEI